MTNVHVSIVTPTLNRADLLLRTIGSLRIQTFGDYEHIVVDGASTDGTVELLASLERTYPLRWISEPDTGMYNAINKGLAMAHGEILAYLNSDDLYFPWTLDTVVEVFRHHPAADFVFGDLLGVDDATGAQTLRVLPPFDLSHVRRFGFLAQPAVFWRRRVLEMEGPFDESLRYVADCDYWMRVGARRSFRKVNEFLAVEREHPTTLRASDERVWTELGQVRARYVDLAGPAHDHARRRERVTRGLWYRIDWAVLLVQTLIPRRLRRGPWARFLNSGRITIHRRRAALKLIPFVARAIRGDLARPDRYWLEPTSRPDRGLG